MEGGQQEKNKLTILDKLKDVVNFLWEVSQFLKYSEESMS
jgi:hypothetical protein